LFCLGFLLSRFFCPIFRSVSVSLKPPAEKEFFAVLVASGDHRSGVYVFHSYPIGTAA
jgi:hypothetical protein